MNDENEFDIENIQDPEAERNIYKILDTPDEYYEDKEFTRKEEFNKQVREERKAKTKEQEKHRARQTRHYPELSRMRRVIGMVDKIHVSMLEDNEKCREMAHQLMSASTIFRKIAFYMLQRHAENCLSKENYKGSNASRLVEMKYSLDLVLKLRLQLDAITKMKTEEEARFDEDIEKMVREVGE